MCVYCMCICCMYVCVCQGVVCMWLLSLSRTRRQDINTYINTYVHTYIYIHTDINLYTFHIQTYTYTGETHPPLHRGTSSMADRPTHRPNHTDRTTHTDHTDHTEPHIHSRSRGDRPQASGQRRAFDLHLIILPLSTCIVLCALCCVLCACACRRRCRRVQSLCLCLCRRMPSNHSRLCGYRSK